MLEPSSSVIVVNAKDLPKIIVLITPQGKKKEYLLRPSSNGEKIALNIVGK